MADYRARLKAALVMLGVLDCAVVRLRLLQISAAEQAVLLTALERAGLLR